MSRAIDDLKNEHEAIRFTLRVLGKMLALQKAGEEVPVGDLEDLVGFLGEFGDKCHHGKEENYLFPAMENRNIFQADNLIANLHAEHDLARNLTHRMGAALGSAGETARFIDSAEEYMGLLDRHIDKEEEILFPLAEAHIPLSELDEVYDGFEDHEEKVIGSGRHEELHSMLDSFGARYLT